MSNFKGSLVDVKKKPEEIQRMDLFEYREKIGTLEQTELGKLNESGWLITNKDSSETWISEKQFKKIISWYEWRTQRDVLSRIE